MPDGGIKSIFSPNSGVTIARGFDLHGRTVAGLKALGFDQDLIQTLKPYLANNLIGNAAAKVSSQLKIKESQAKIIDDAIFTSTVSAIEANFDRDVSYAKFRQMPAGIQTALADLAFNFGPNLSAKKATPILWRHVVAGDWKAVVRNLRTGFKGQTGRRKREANLIDQAVNSEHAPIPAIPSKY